jgi:D-alanyl-D-alanine carboxypeptidase/D-alanyl-D-alanine-endopeptidase (penicillin-binding protein 4)
MRRLALVALVLAVPGVAAAGSGRLHSRLAGTAAIAGVAPAHSTAMVVSLPSGHVLFARNPDLALEPASNEKLGVTYAALVELGPSYRFPTEVLGEGRRSGATWDGTLFLKGFGDPTLSSADLARLAAILWGEGIRRVTGGIVGDASAFDAARGAPGWLPSFAGFESPPLSALVVDRADRAGRMVADPPLAAAARLYALLHAVGIETRGASVAAAGPHAVVLATIFSPPLAQILEFMDHWSDNFTAEMLLKAIGFTVLGRGTTAAGAEVTRRDLAAAGVPLAGVRIADGSGLSRLDRVTARELTTLLVKIWDVPALRQVVLAALPVAGESGTLSYRLNDTPDHQLVRAKTGTTDVASALSGYVGTRFAFVAIENGYPVNDAAAHSAEDAVAEALLDQLGTGRR